MAGVVTGEAVALELRTARIASRLLAGLLDGLLLLALLLLATFLLTAAQFELDPAAAAALGIVTYLGIFVGYPTVFETLLRGRTPGKAALGVRVVRDDGGPIRFRHALTRGLTLALFELPTLYMISLLVQISSERGKRLGDLLAGTFVVQERVPSTAASSVPMPAPLAGWAAGLDLSRLPDDLALSMRQFLGRAGSLTPVAREDLGARLTAAVAATTSPPPPPGTPGWAYLAAVLAERRRRAEARLAPFATSPPAGGPGFFGAPRPLPPQPQPQPAPYQYAPQSRPPQAAQPQHQPWTPVGDPPRETGPATPRSDRAPDGGSSPAPSGFVLPS